jgi:predicted nucleic acid-binding protein
MPQFKVIDASVAIKWFISKEENLDKALKLLEEIQASPSHFAVPELFFNEMLAVLCKLLDDSEEVKKYISILESLGFYRVGNGNELLMKAADISIKYGLTGYDAIYAASAKLLDGLWITADSKAHKRIQKLKISQAL